MKKTTLSFLLLLAFLVTPMTAGTLFTATDEKDNVTDLNVDVFLEDVAQGLRVTLTLNPSSDGNIGDITGLYLNYDGSIPASGAISNVTSNDANADAGDITYTVGGSMPPYSAFDMYFQIGGPGKNAAGLDVQMISFIVASTPGLSAADFTGVGVRVQSVGAPTSSRDGSLKLVSWVPSVPNENTEVPEPTAFVLFGSGLACLALCKARRR